MTVSVLGESAMVTTISGLKDSTTYSIQVAAVNNVGTGVYSNSSIEKSSMYSCIM